MKKIIFLILGLILVLTYASVAHAGEVGLDVSPGRVDIGPDFNGADLTITGEAPGGSDIYIKVASPDDSVLELNRKGKVGPFWMNVENTTVTEVPKLYLILSSAPLDSAPADLSTKLGISGDFSYIYSRAVVKKHTENESVKLPKESADSYVSALINIYREGGLYGIKENAVSVKDGKFTAKVMLPPNIPQEMCSVTAYAVRDGVLLGSASASFSVTGVGLVRWLSRESIFFGPEYGFLAVMIALAFGAGIAVLFGKIENMLGKGKNTGFSAGAGR